VKLSVPLPVVVKVNLSTFKSPGEEAVVSAPVKVPSPLSLVIKNPLRATSSPPWSVPLLNMTSI